MTDHIDSANDLAQLNTESALYVHQRDKDTTRQIWLGGVVVCIDCEMAIPSPRLLVIPDCARCIDCQTAHEIRARQ